MRRLRLLWLVPVAFMALAPVCIDQQQWILGPNSTSSINGDPGTGILSSIIGQTVTAGRSGELVAVSLDVYDCDGTGTATLEVQATSAGVPNGVVLTSQTISPPASDPGRLTRFELATPVHIDEGTMFAIIVRPEPGALNACRLRLGPSGDSYAGGRGVVQIGSTWFDFPDGSPKDLAFQTWVSTP